MPTELSRPTELNGYYKHKGMVRFQFLDMLENWLLPQLNTNYDDYIPQLDGAPPHFDMNVRMLLLNRVLQQR